MTTGIEKFKQQERIRRLFFKYRGDMNTIIKETGLDGDYIRSVTNKIKRSFSHDINFEIACFITDAILSGREQRLIILEDRLHEILKDKRVESICCAAPVSKHEYEGSTWYKCEKCKGNCEIQEVDMVNDTQVARLINTMRKEDELIAKFVVAIGIVAANPEQPNNSLTTESKKIPVQSMEINSLPPSEKRMLEKLNQLDESKVMEIRRLVETKIEEALNNDTSK